MLYKNNICHFDQKKVFLYICIYSNTQIQCTKSHFSQLPLSHFHFVLGAAHSLLTLCISVFQDKERAWNAVNVTHRRYQLKKRGQNQTKVNLFSLMQFQSKTKHRGWSHNAPDSELTAILAKLAEQLLVFIKLLSSTWFQLEIPKKMFSGFVFFRLTNKSLMCGIMRSWL